MSTFVGVPRMPAPTGERLSADQTRIVRMACSLLLDYPDDTFLERVEAVRRELPNLPQAVAANLAQFCDYAAIAGTRELQVQYVETFDQKRRCALGLTYYTHGDTRSRGQAIIGFKEALCMAGFEVVRDELPDHLPLLLEFCAVDDTDTAEHLLQANREALEVIRTALRSCQSPWVPVMEALILTLPEASDEVMAAYAKLVSQGPPTELVGIGDLNATPCPYSSSMQEV